MHDGAEQRQVLGETTWDTVGQRGFDHPQVFGSYLNTLRWNCVTSTDPGLFQAPLRAGIDVKPYQLEPLRKALRMPRVSLFIADDVGLGKTIEAGLILRELLLRQRVHRVVVVPPPSMVLQWQGEMQSRFGLSFAVMDRKYISEMRRQRGWGINPWATHTRFIISQALVRDKAYAGPLRDWLGEEGKQKLLILDEAHNAAPASGSKFAIDSYSPWTGCRGSRHEVLTSRFVRQFGERADQRFEHQPQQEPDRPQRPAPHSRRPSRRPRST